MKDELRELWQDGKLWAKAHAGLLIVIACATLVLAWLTFSGAVNSLLLLTLALLGVAVFVERPLHGKAPAWKVGVLSVCSLEVFLISLHYFGTAA